MKLGKINLTFSVKLYVTAYICIKHNFIFKEYTKIEMSCYPTFNTSCINKVCILIGFLFQRNFCNFPIYICFECITCSKIYA